MQQITISYIIASSTIAWKLLTSSFSKISVQKYRSSLRYQATNEIVQNPVQEESYLPKLFFLYVDHLSL
jgi:hypothetical protein